MKNRTVFVGMHIHRFITNILINIMSGNFTFHNFINCNNPEIADHLYSIFFEILSDKDSIHAGNSMENGMEVMHTGVIEITQKGNTGPEYKKEDGAIPDKTTPNGEHSISKQQEPLPSIQAEAEPKHRIVNIRIIATSCGCKIPLQCNAAFYLLHTFRGVSSSTRGDLRSVINSVLIDRSMLVREALKTRQLQKVLKCSPARKAVTSFRRKGEEPAVIEAAWLYLLLMLFDKIQILEVADCSMHV